MKSLLLLLCLFTLPCRAAEPQRFLLWPDGAPEAKGTTEDHQPTLDFYKPDAVPANGCAVVICPGGGYGGLAKDHEGIQPARFFNSLGITAYVLHYRLGGKGYQHPIPLQDAQRALRLARSRAAADGVDPTRIGIMGFSAGGHLAASTGTHHDAGNAAATDPVDRLASRPDFMILCYGVLSFDPAITHQGSVNNLLGDRRNDSALLDFLSNEKQVNATTRPLSCSTPPPTRPSRWPTACAFTKPARKTKSPSPCTSFRKANTASALPKTTPTSKSGPPCSSNGSNRMAG